MKKATYITTIVISIVVLLVVSFILVAKKANDYIIDDFKNNKSTSNNEVTRSDDEGVIATGMVTDMDLANRKITLSERSRKTEIMINEKNVSEFSEIKAGQIVKVTADNVNGTLVSYSIKILSETAQPSGQGTATSTPQATSTPISKEENKYSDMIRVEKITSGQLIKSPLVIDGEARGSWYFEGVFPVVLYDGGGKELARGNAEAIGDWMTTDFVPFNVKLDFKIPSTEKGTLTFMKDNPSGLPANDKKYEIPVRFK